MTKKKGAAVPAERISQSIVLMRGQKVLLDSDLATLYGVETRALVQSVKRNLERFPDDFMFQLTEQEVNNLISQSVISSWGGRRTRPSQFITTAHKNFKRHIWVLNNFPPRF